MIKLTSDTFARPADLSDRTDPAVLYARSYLLIRTVVGLLGIALPFVLVGVDALFLQGSVVLRDSLSAYYFTGARDLFVGALCIIGCLLMTYLAAQPHTLDFWLSLVAGTALLAVALFPTRRPSVDPGPLTPLQRALGEDAVAAVHFVGAGVFILGLAALCFVFAHRDAKYGAGAARVRLHRTCGVLIVAAVGWALLGFWLPLDLGWVTSLYLAEVVSTWSFGLSWLVKGYDLRAVLRLGARRP